jgi:uncharacterized protein YdaU (DUF1376 family)
MSGNPYIALYIGDWRKDLAVQSLSFYHRGIWFELLMLMHCSEERGRLVLSGKPMTTVALSRLLGLSERETSSAVEILVSQGVASRDKRGALINRRMAREEDIRKKRKEAGALGGSKAQANREQTPDIDNGTDSGLERVREFARGEGIAQSDADWFYWKGEGNGWTNKGQPILDWKATLRSWKRGGYLPSQRHQSSPGFVRPKERAPSYPELPPKREPTPEELANAKAIAAGEVAKLKAQLRK